MSEETTIHYRPVGEKELALIAESRYRAFPPRLFWQTIFYPVLNEEYARDIARDWNARDGKHVYVTRFVVQTAYLTGCDVQKVGKAIAREYRIPAEELDTFNQNIVGLIEGITEYPWLALALNRYSVSALTRPDFTAATSAAWSRSVWSA